LRRVPTPCLCRVYEKPRCRNLNYRRNQSFRPLSPSPWSLSSSPCQQLPLSIITEVRRCAGGRLEDPGSTGTTGQLFSPWRFARGRLRAGAPAGASGSVIAPGSAFDFGSVITPIRDRASRGAWTDLAVGRGRGRKITDPSAGVVGGGTREEGLPQGGSSPEQDLPWAGPPTGFARFDGRASPAAGTLPRASGLPSGARAAGSPSRAALRRRPPKRRPPKETQSTAFFEGHSTRKLP
jgi:hypothetical protein